MRWLIFACWLGCDDNAPVEAPVQDLSVRRITLDLSGSGTTCIQAINCMQGCSDSFTSCSGHCAGSLNPTAQTKWNTFVACLQLKCGPGDGSLPICDNFSDSSCIACANANCAAEIADCGDH